MSDERARKLLAEAAIYIMASDCTASNLKDRIRAFLEETEGETLGANVAVGREAVEAAVKAANTLSYDKSAPHHFQQNLAAGPQETAICAVPAEPRPQRPGIPPVKLALLCIAPLLLPRGEVCPFEIPPPLHGPACVDFDDADLADCNEVRLEAYVAPYAALCFGWTLLQDLLAEAFSQCWLDHPRDPYLCMTQAFADLEPHFDRLFRVWNRHRNFIELQHGVCVEALCP